MAGGIIGIIAIVVGIVVVISILTRNTTTIIALLLAEYIGAIGEVDMFQTWTVFDNIQYTLLRNIIAITDI